MGIGLLYCNHGQIVEESILHVVRDCPMGFDRHMAAFT